MTIRRLALVGFAALALGWLAGCGKDAEKSRSPRDRDRIAQPSGSDLSVILKQQYDRAKAEAAAAPAVTTRPEVGPTPVSPPADTVEPSEMPPPTPAP